MAQFSSSKSKVDKESPKLMAEKENGSVSTLTN